MASNLSSNWKTLQAKLKADGATTTTTTTTAASKRKADATTTTKQHAHPPAKRQKQDDRPRSDKQTQKQNKPSSATKPKPARPGNLKARAPAPTTMGVTQSSAVAKGSASTVTPSLALWAEDHDISAEALAEAYGLGVRRNAMLKQGQGPAAAERVNEGAAPNVVADLGKYVALDCEMVGTGPDGHDSALARVSMVDFHGRQVYDALVRPAARVTDWRTRITGLTPGRMAGARDFAEVQAEVADLLRGRVLVGHDLRHDLAALELGHPPDRVRDTARFAGYRQYGHGPKPALRVLAREVLDVEIQAGAHSSVEDARVAMLLFRRKKSEFDMEHANRFERPPPGQGPARTSPLGKKKKKRKKH